MPKENQFNGFNQTNKRRRKEEGAQTVLPKKKGRAEARRRRLGGMGDRNLLRAERERQQRRLGG